MKMADQFVSALVSETAWENVTSVMTVNQSNNSQPLPCNGTPWLSVTSQSRFEYGVSIAVPVIFTIIAILGFVGNLLVIIVVVTNQQMRNTTNVLIISLAVADLCFIIMCVPFTATVYALPMWIFGNIMCKIYQYMISVTAFASIYTLVLMSLDRYLAVVHPISSMDYRTEKNAYIVTLITWAIILATNVPTLFQAGVISYDFFCDTRSTCLNNLAMVNQTNGGQIYYGNFFVFGYLLPVILIVVLYGFMLHRLLYRMVPGGQSAESTRSKKRVTKMVVIVVVIFALCWLPIQIIFMVLHFGSYPDGNGYMVIQIFSTCIAYMNSCVNPFLYAFLSENFRKSFRKLMCCTNNFAPIKLEVERTTHYRMREAPRNNKNGAITNTDQTDRLLTKATQIGDNAS